MLKQIGAWSFKHKWWVVSGWTIILAIVLTLMFMYQTPASNQLSIPGTDAQVAIDKLRQTFPGAANASGRIVFEAPQGKTLDDYKTQIAETLSRVDKVDAVDTVVSPFQLDNAQSGMAQDANIITDDRKIGFATVQLDISAAEVVDETATDITAALQPVRDAGVTAEINGDIVAMQPSGILGVGEIVGVLVALIVLVVTFRSLIAAGVPLLVAIVAVGLGVGGLYALSGQITVDSTSPVLAVMLGLAVGIDYSLFIVSRYRRFLRDGYANHVAAAKSIATAGNAVIFAASTVVIALAALTVVQIPFMTTMGLAAAATVATAAIVSVTLTPALMSIIGLRIFRKKERTPVVKAQAHEYHEDEDVRRRGWHAWGEGLQKYPILIIVVVVVGLGAVAWPVQHLQMGLPTDQHAAKDSTERKAYDILERGFGAGFNGPLLVLVENMPAVSEADKQAVRAPAMAELNKQIAQQTAAAQAQMQQAMASATSPADQMALQQQAATMQAQGEQQKQQALAKVEQSVEQYAKYVQLTKIADKFKTVANVDVALPVQVTDDGTKGLIQIAPESGPSDKATIDLIATLRSDGNTIIGNDAPELYVTGTTALQADIDKKLAEVLPVYLAVVVGLSFIILVIAFRSILVPIKATLGFLLSVAAMFGALVMAFQWGWIGVEPTPIVSFLPIIGVGILFGLAMDYEFFMVSSIHESYHESGDAKAAVVDGFAHGAKVVLAAAAIMTAIFAGFVFHHDDIIKQMGFALAIGVFIDAVIIRLTLVPAVMTLFSKAAWWLPNWLGKLLPHISVEGDDK